MTDSIKWQTENDIVIPVTAVEANSDAVSQDCAQTDHRAAIADHSRQKKHYDVPSLLVFPYKEPEDNVPVEVAGKVVAEVADSLATDSLAANVAGETMKGIVIENPASEFIKESGSANQGNRAIGDGLSWLYMLLAVLFCAVAMRFKGSSRYMKALFTDLTDTRLRHNAFDDTARETSLLVLLNLMWAVNAGVMLWALVRTGVGSEMTGSFSLPDNPARGVWICTAVAAAYIVVMLLAYWIVGNVFSDRRHSQLWVKGAAASTALETFLLFPVALLTLIYPEWNAILLLIAGVIFLMGKIVFLYKGFRIFFSEISSWLLFLYYLCSLEIVPLILTYVGAVAACGTWL